MADATTPSPTLHSDGAGPYLIQVHGMVSRHWELELQMQLTYGQTEWGTISTLTGQLPDQAALLGTLGRLAMWGYKILLVRYDVVPDLQADERLAGT